MSFADDLGDEERSGSRRSCGLCAWLEDYDESDAVEEAFAAGRSRSAIWRALQRHGYPQTLNVVDRHYRERHWEPAP